VHDILLYAARTHGAKKAFGAREVEKVINEDKVVTKMVSGKEEKQTKTWSYFKLKPYDWMTYEGALQRVQQIGSGLRELGSGGEDETFFNIYAGTS
jgi:long-chain acyl-CoA synthetase